MKDINHERLLRFGDMRNNGSDSRARLLSQMEASFAPQERAYLMDVLAFAESLDYQHGRLTKEVYLAHPYRVAALSMDILQPPNVHITALALVHNVLEVVDIPDAQLAKSVGDDLVQELKALTVDRSQSSAEYFAGYYEGLYSSTVPARVVKALDKLDNLFMLCLNPDDDVRASYLEEIDRYIIPIVRDELPYMTDYFEDLVRDCQNVGHLSL